MAERIIVNSKKPVSIKENLISHKRKTDFRSNSSPVNRILYLQRTIGNQAVQRMVRSGALQAKLRIGQPGDVYEQEADRVADAVMRMPEPGVQRQVEPEEEEEEEETLQSKPLTNQITPLVQVQRQEEPEEEEETLQAKPLAEEITHLVQRQVEPEEEEEELQAKATSGRISEVNSNLESHIQSFKGGGQPLSENDRAFFEPRFGYDFGQVRMHTDTQAAESARAVNAQAFTVGKDVMFGAGQYAPETGGGRRLMAHELTHVVQHQGIASISRKEVEIAKKVAPVEKAAPVPKTIEPTITYWSSADSSTVSAYALGVIKDVLKAAGETKAEISSTTRTAADQARVMYYNIVSKGVESQKRLYGSSGDKVIDVYVKLKGEGKNKAEIKAAMEAKINEVGSKKVSKHCGDPTKLQVIDVAPSSISNKAKFIAEAEKDTRVSNFLKPPDDPGYHFEIRPK